MPSTPMLAPNHIQNKPIGLPRRSRSGTGSIPRVSMTPTRSRASLLIGFLPGGGEVFGCLLVFWGGGVCWVLLWPRPGVPQVDECCRESAEVDRRIRCHKLCTDVCRDGTEADVRADNGPGHRGDRVAITAEARRIPARRPAIMRKQGRDCQRGGNRFLGGYSHSDERIHDLERLLGAETGHETLRPHNAVRHVGPRHVVATLCTESCCFYRAFNRGAEGGSVNA